MLTPKDRLDMLTQMERLTLLYLAASEEVKKNRIYYEDIRPLELNGGQSMAAAQNNIANMGLAHLCLRDGQWETEPTEVGLEVLEIMPGGSGPNTPFRGMLDRWLAS